ncbi:hypothetical protein [Arthrobacter sp. B6]|uniref:hypothetical protein n=1 Tax=Arthrobacter sp. B6 TaxID=1570137 RepID=UPI000AC74D65|nr:hypothetical protein [Arthrobacter sp. B6]
MQFLQVVLVCVIVAGALQVGLWIRNAKYIAAIFGSVYIVVYLVDVLNISMSESTYIAASVGRRSASEGAVSTAIVAVIVTWILFSLSVQAIIRRQDQRGAPVTVVRTHRFSLMVFVLLSIIFGGAVLSKILTVGIAETLQLRQAVFSDNFLVLLGYFILPVLVSLGLCHAVQTKGMKALLMWILVLGLLGVTALTGSRSGLFLGAVLPVLALYAKKIAASTQSVGRDMQRLLLTVALIAVPVLGGGFYLANTRGLVESGSVLNGTDISQADVLVDLISAEAGGVGGGSSYLASLTSALPRSLWPDKPLPGNVLSSILLTPDRYYTTGAETTAGLLGEAYINAGHFAPAVAAFLMLAFLLVCSKFLDSANDITWMLGVILLVRGLNLLRGDMTNVIVPATAAILVWVMLHRKNRENFLEGSPPMTVRS